MIYFDWTWLILIPGIIFSFYAQSKINKNYSVYSRVPCKSGITGADAARRIMKANNISDVDIEHVSGELSDHYDPRSKTVRLSDGVFDAASVASVAIAAHEIGHVIQHQQGYFPLKFRNAIIPVTNLTSRMSWPIFLIGIIISSFGSRYGGIIMDVGIVCFAIALIFYIITLPVEFNASSRAITQLTECGIITDSEREGAKKVLGAAAMTYVASTLSAFLSLFRMMAIRGRRR
ncbi:MAG: zinc metallopeptidase [Eubacteriaceae bacterium]|nr:zinc metallopeptidase [Eubacteriaceae bacterium]